MVNLVVVVLTEVKTLASRMSQSKTKQSVFDPFWVRDLSVFPFRSPRGFVLSLNESKLLRPSVLEETHDTVRSRSRRGSDERPSGGLTDKAQSHNCRPRLFKRSDRTGRKIYIRRTHCIGPSSPYVYSTFIYSSRQSLPLHKGFHRHPSTTPTVSMTD